MISFNEALKRRLDQHKVRIDYFRELRTLHRNMPGSEIKSSKDSHLTWPKYQLVKGEEVIASVYTSGSMFLNHWFT